MIDEVFISQQLFEIVLENARSVYPREVILLLRGKAKKGRVEITDIVIPPFATHGRGFSSFPLQALSMDFSLIGSVHSHPSGDTTPSVEDFNHSFGRIMMIVAHPFLGRKNVSVYNSSGDEISLELNE